MAPAGHQTRLDQCMKTTRLLYWALIWCIIVLVACATDYHPTATPTFIPAMQEPTRYQPTSTPTFVPITPEPTRTPLSRATKITATDYGQTLELVVGDTFGLEKMPGDNSPTTIGDVRVLQKLPVASGADSGQERYKAIAPGMTALSSIVSVPCPHAPVGCEPPINFIYVTVSVRSPCE